MLGLSLIFLLSLTTYIAYLLGKKTTLSTPIYMGAYFIKMLVGCAYIWLFTNYFANGLLFGDSQSFMLDSWQLNQLAKHDFNAFIQLMFGFIDGNDIRVTEFIQNTQIWDYNQSNELINDNRLFIKLNAFIHFISFRNPYFHVLCFSFLSFLGLHLIYQSFQKFVSRKSWFWLSIILFPNLCFWSSGLLKESLLIFGLGVFFYSFFKVIAVPRKNKYYLLLILSILILAFNKPYTGLTVMLFASFYFIAFKLNWRKDGIKYSFILTFLIACGLIFIPGKLNITQKLSIKQIDLNNMGKGGIAFINDSAFCVFPYQNIENFKVLNKDFIQVKNESKGNYKLFGEQEFHPFTIYPKNETYAVYLIYPPSKSYVKQTLINFSPLQLIQNIPVALLNTVVRPFPSDGGNRFKYFSFLSNLLLIGFILFAYTQRKVLSRQEQHLLFFLIASAMTILLIIGLSVPIFGAIVRYKIPAELFLIIAGFILIKPKYEKQ